MVTPQSSAFSTNSVIVAAVEGGGTSFKVAVVQLLPSTSTGGGASLDSPRDVRILHRAEIPSDVDPHECLRRCADFFRQHNPTGSAGSYQALGVACFGPLGLHSDAPTYGRILQSSPKAVWRNVDVLSPLVEACSSDRATSHPKQEMAVMIDTDVNAPALVEYRRALLQQEKLQPPLSPFLSSCAYVTVGTGVGVGLVVNGRTVHGRMHPEAGHVSVPPLLRVDTFEGYSWGKQSCPYFGINTVEGTTSSVALVERLQHQLTMTKQEGMPSSELWSSTGQGRNVLASLPDDHEVWDHAVHALSSLCVTLLLTVSIERIVLGGGIIQRRPALLERIRDRVPLLVNGYLDLPRDMSELIVTSEYGDDAGLFGAIGLAQEALARRNCGEVDGQNTKCDVFAAAAAEEADETKRIKQVAFGHGLWHGMLVGGVGTALIFKYALIPLLNKTRRQR